MPSRISHIRSSALMLAASLAVGIPGAAMGEDAGPGIATPQQRLFVVGRDAEIPLEAVLPAECEGARVTFALYSRGGAAAVNTVAYPSGTAGATASGSAVSGTIHLDAAIFSTTDSVWPGVSGECMDRPLVSTGPSLLIGQLSDDPRTSTFIIPRSSLFMGREQQQVHAVLVVRAAGARCTEANLDDPKTKDDAGNAVFVLGGTGQPASCSEPGALVELYYPNGDVLFETRVVVPGVVQPFANLAPAPGPSTSAEPAAPGTGSGAPTAVVGANESAWRSATGLAMAILLPAGTLALLRRWARGRA